MDRRVALVTGASRGIGRAVALKLAQEGYFVAVNYRTSMNAAEEVVQAILASGGEGVALGFDVSQPGVTENAVKSLAADVGIIDVLVNNAGIIRDQPFIRMRDEDWRQVIDVNLMGTYHCTRATVKTWVGKRRGRRIVNITSVAGEMGNAYQTNYCASKGGVVSFTKALALELAPKKITVNAVSPGFIATEGMAHLAVEDLVGKIPLGRIGLPEEIAHAVSFLVSEGSDYITGQVLRVNGGLYM